VPMLRVFNETARYVDQGGGKRKGAIAVYLEPWHADVIDFLDLRKNQGKEELRARDLFTALWISDIFMERVDANEKWPLFSPDEVPMLTETYGSEFREWFLRYESEGKALKTVEARDLWNRVLTSQIETGTPYMLYKDSVNEKSNQKNIGIIRSSNLCTEILIHTNPEEVAVCNLASIPVNRFVTIPGGKSSKDKSKRSYDFEALYEAAYQATLNLNRVIDINYYPIPEAEVSNKKNRPIGIGIQGLADTFVMLGQSFDSDESKALNRDIYETIYFAAVTASCDLAKKNGAYETYQGSPASEGKLQYDMWGLTEDNLSGRWDWKSLKTRIAKYGMRNSLLTTQMPTATTAQILGNNESFEPFSSNLYSRSVLAGNFTVVNKHLVEDLVNLGLWNDDMRIKLIAAQGSVQNVSDVPEYLKERYKTIWEISQKTLLDMSAERGRFICQTQSMNLFIRDVNVAKLTSAHFHGWRLGLKTGMYYLRSNQAVNAQAGLAVDQTKLQAAATQAQEDSSAFCSLDNPENCDSCSA
jgi:ribonucleoside-diphosphate reductase alpha chain